MIIRQWTAKVPQRFPFDAHFGMNVAQETGRTLLHHMLHPQSSFDVLHHPFHESDKVLGIANISRYSLCNYFFISSSYIKTSLFFLKYYFLMIIYHLTLQKAVLD